MRSIVKECAECYGLTVALEGVGTGKKPVPGTGRLDCPHMEAPLIGVIAVTHIVHLSLSTLLRAPEMLADRDMAHVIQEWLRVPPLYRRTVGLPWTLIDGHGVSSRGLATARILARMMSATTAPADAVYWRAAANIMRVRGLS